MAKRTRRTLIVSKSTLDAALSEPGGLNKLMDKVPEVATLNFEIIDHGVDGAQYFFHSGCGDWQDSITGIGDSAREAGADAFNMMETPDGVDDSALRADLAKLDDTDDAHSMCSDTDSADHEMCEMHHYVSIRWSVTP